METSILTGLLGLLTGGIIVGLYYSSKLNTLHNQILDKHTIIKLIKDHGKFDKVSMNGKPKPKRRYNKTRRSAKKSTAGMKQVKLSWYLFYITIGTAGQRLYVKTNV